MAKSDFTPAPYTVGRPMKAGDDAGRRPSWPARQTAGNSGKSQTDFKAVLDAVRAKDSFVNSGGDRQKFNVTVVCSLLTPIESISPDGAEQTANAFLRTNEAALRAMGLRVERVIAENFENRKDD